MKIYRTSNQLSQSIHEYTPKDIGFVPTMGALHDGHLKLINRAKEENRLVVCSIFVNPIQFNNADDLAKYPRSEEDDIQKLEESGCNLLFLPSVEEIYPHGLDERVDYHDELFNKLEGKFRPGHFLGVVTVVKKLLEIVKPDRAYFGKKDYQQLRIIKNLVEYYDLRPEIVPVEIVREDDGLALSSRNLRLNEEQRKLAPRISKTLKEASEKLLAEQIPKKIIEEATEKLNQLPDFQVEYIEIVDSQTFEPIEKAFSGQVALICCAVYVGNVRLIDNKEVKL